MTKEENLQCDIERALDDFLGLPLGTQFPTSEWTDLARLFAGCCALSHVMSVEGLMADNWEVRDRAKQLTVELGRLVEAFGAVVE